MTNSLRTLFFATLALPCVVYGQSYEGSLDAANCSIIGGWAADGSQPNTPINVDIYDGNTKITTVLANTYRSDLGFVNYYHAFTINTPASLKNNAYHYIIAKYGGTQLQLGNSDIPLYCTAGSTGYQYYYSDTFGSINSTAWYQNGSITTGSGGLTSSSSSGGSVISKAAVPDGTSQYEVKATLTLNAPTQSGETYALYLRGTSNALSGPAASGTFYAFELQNPTFSGSSCSAAWTLYRTVNGSASTIGTGSYSCHNGMVVRLVYTINSWIIAYIDNVGLIWVSDGSIGTGQPGVGVRNSPAGHGIQRVDLGPLDRIAPTVIQNPITSSGFPDHIDMKWGGSVDDPNGIGLWTGELYRNLANQTPPQPPASVSQLETWDTSFSDWGIPVNGSTTNTNVYTYTVTMYDFHLNSTTFAFNASSPPAGSIDPREVGVRPLGSYWGGDGEQIDMRSGNLNYSIPLVKAQGRGGWGVGFNLSYNSQNWRQDPAGIWQLGRDTGYGYGWRLQAGSLTPVYENYWTILYWLFIDSTGAEYKLNQWNGSVWTSVEGIYLSFNPNVTGSPGSTHLYFPDGSFWELNALSAGTEQDAGTYYPSLMEDTNGNQILITYKPGLNVSYPNSSARIATIEDVRGKGVTNYSFTYNTDLIPHLTGITNSIGTPENYSFCYSPSSSLISPFNSQNFATVRFLQSATVTGPNLITNFAYDTSGGGTNHLGCDNNGAGPSGSGELTQMTTPYGGHLHWTYTQYTLSGARTFREVQNRYLLMCASSMAAYCSANGGTETQYQIVRDSNDSGRSVHYWAWLIDNAAPAAKVWYFQTDTTQFNKGLQTIYQERTYPANLTIFEQDFTWAQTPTSLNAYISSTLTTLDPGQSYQAQKKTTQALDQYGNLLNMQQYDFGNLSTPVRYYVNTYLADSNYISRFITNRLVKSTVANAANCATAPLCTTLVSNTYDSPPSDLPGVHEHDATYNTTFLYRGNLVSTVTPAGTKGFAYDIGGNVTTTNLNGVLSTVTTSSSTNYAAPYQITTNTLAPSTMNWNAALGLSSAAGPNGDTASFGYDTNGRPTSTTSPTGAVTNYTYADTASPPNKTATTNTHWVQTSMDGFGRTIMIWNNSTAGGGSIVQTFYDPCGCSPLGKMSQVSQPFAPNGTVYWTKYTYDASGRTTKIALPDSSATTYAYQGNTVTVTDPAHNAKTFTMDAFGNLTKVVETDPTLGQVSTNYTYDMLNHLITVSMPRGSNTQTRTFNYIPSGTTTVGAYLLSATNPENGAVSYAYNSNGTLASKTDAKGQVFTYSYDSYNRLHQVFVGGVLLRTFMYDTNTLDGSFSGPYTNGRLVAVQNAQFTPGSSLPTEFTEMYSYTLAGQPNKKRLQINVTSTTYPYPVFTNNLDAVYSYDTEGKMTSVQYPSTSSGAGPTYTYSFDTMSRPIGLTDQNNYAAVSGVQYGGANAPPTAMSSISYFGETETRQYNTLMQLTDLNIAGTVNGLHYNYRFPSGTNNGKISSQYDYVSGETITYAYDSLNRLLSASGSGWNQSFGFDGFGNLTSKSGSNSPPLSVVVNAATNQIQGVSGLSYDFNGNELYGGVAYDAENRLLSAPGVQYAYDSKNKRVWKGTFSGSTLTAQEAYFYGIDGQKLGTYSLVVSGSQVIATNTYLAVFFGSKLVAMTQGPALAPVIQDRLGSNGKYFPYGEDRSAPANDQVKFATYTRDSATLLDYADQRYYSNQFGRFMSPDPYKGNGGGPGDPTNPQSWNRYAYVLSDPINFKDPTGRFECGDDEDFEDCNDGGGGGGGGFCGIGFHFDAVMGDCEPNGGPPPSDPKTPQPECFAQLKNRPVNDPKAKLVNAQHSFWWVQDSTGANYIISGGPQAVKGSPDQYLDVWAVPGQSNGQDNASQHTQWSSGLSSTICDLVAKMLAAALGFPKDKIYYDPVLGPNSNSAAHYLAEAAGFNPAVPSNFYGWDTEILVP